MAGYEGKRAARKAEAKATGTRPQTERQATGHDVPVGRTASGRILYGTSKEALATGQYTTAQLEQYYKSKKITPPTEFLRQVEKQKAAEQAKASAAATKATGVATQTRAEILKEQQRKAILKQTIMGVYEKGDREERGRVIGGVEYVKDKKFTYGGLPSEKIVSMWGKLTKEEKETLAKTYGAEKIQVGSKGTVLWTFPKADTDEKVFRGEYREEIRLGEIEKRRESKKIREVLPGAMAIEEVSPQSSILSETERKQLIKQDKERRIKRKEDIKIFVTKAREEGPSYLRDVGKGLIKIKARSMQEKYIPFSTVGKEPILWDPDVAKAYKAVGVATTFSPFPGAPYVGGALVAAGEIGERGKRTPEGDIEISKRDVGISAITGATWGFGLGAGMKFVETPLKMAGKRALIAMGLGTGKKLTTKSLIGVAGAGLIETGKVVERGVKGYFAKEMGKEAFEIGEHISFGEYGRATLKGSEFTGSVAGFVAGAKGAEKVIRGGLVAAGRVPPFRPEKKLKRRPTPHQIKELTSGERIAIYRRGAIQKEIKPRKDIYPGPAKTEKQIFLRDEPLTKVKGKKAKFTDITVPLFAQPASYGKMFLANIKQFEKKGPFKKYVHAFAETPLVSGMIAGTIKTKKIPSSLRKKAITEMATRKGGLSKSTQRELEKYDTLISEKTRKWAGAEEEEAALKRVYKVPKKYKVDWVWDIRTGEFIPVVRKKGMATRDISNIRAQLRHRKTITEQDARLIAQQWGLWKEYGVDLVRPRKHAGTHYIGVQKNIGKLIDLYPELHKPLKKKYGTIKKAKEELGRLGPLHDIGKTGETSAEFGTPHGQKVFDVWKRGMLPSDIKLTKSQAKAIKTHETLETRWTRPSGLMYHAKDFFGMITPEQKLLSTADRLDLARYGMKVDPSRLPLGDVFKRMGKKEPKREPFIKDIFRQVKERKKKVIEYDYRRVGRGIGYTGYRYKTLYKTPYKAPYKEPYKTPYKTPYKAPYKAPYGLQYGKPYKPPYKTPYGTPTYKPPARAPPYKAPPRKPPGPPPTIIKPIWSEDGKKKKKARRTQWERLFEYRPSLTAIERVRVKKMPSLKEFSGIEMRPIVERTKKGRMSLKIN